jgi:hypothetical protein
MSIIEKGNDWARKNPLKFILIAIVIIGLSINIGSKIGTSLRSDDANSNSTNSNSNSASEEVSKKAYRAGYNDGQMGYGLPASERATAMESYLAHNYNFSSADIPVYEMGYNDAVSGKSSEY